MTTPSLKPNRTPNRMFAELVQKHSGNVYALSSLLLESSAQAEDVTIHTFAELHKSYQQENFKLQLFPVQAYQSCIRQCSAVLTSSTSTSSSKRLLGPDDKILCALWYGLKLPLAEISVILEKTAPMLKEQLRAIREKMNGEINETRYPYDSPA